MPEREDESANGEAGESNPWDAPPLVKAALAYGALAYVAGFVTTSLNAARYGYLLPEMTKEQTLWAGAFPTLIFIAAVGAIRAAQKALDPEHPLSTYQVAVELFSVARILAMVLLGGVLQIAFTHWFIIESTPNGIFLPLPESARRWYLEHQTWFGGLVILILMVLWTRETWLFVTKFRSSSPVHSARFVRQTISGLAIIISAVFVVFGYPNLPFRYGFGAPAKVRLIVANDYTTTVPLPIDKTGGEKDKVRITGEVELLLKTEKEYVVRVDNEHPPISVGTDGIKGIIWSAR